MTTVAGGPLVTGMTIETLTKYETELRAQGYRPSTIRVKLTAARGVCEWADVPPEELTREDVLGWLGARERAEWTRIKYLSHLSAFFTWAGLGDLTSDIRRPRTPTGIPKPVSEAGLTAMLASAQPGRERAMVLLGAFCGLRAHETAKVAGRDLEQAPDGAHLLRVLGKGGQEALIPVPPVVMHELRPLLTGPGRLWPRATSDTVQRTIRAVATRAGIDCSSHQLRHRYGTVVYAESRDLLATQQAMRHRSPTTTAGYALVVADRVSDIVSRLPGAQQPVDESTGRRLRVVR